MVNERGAGVQQESGGSSAGRSFRPAGRPRWMTAEQYESLPAALRRELRYRRPRRGQRTLCLTLTTTQPDPVRCPKEGIAALYRVRWQAESAFSRHKRLLGSALRGKSDALREHECFLRVLTHNLMLLAAG